MQSSSPTLKIIGSRYELQDLLGEGGAGQVYQAYDRLEQKLVALKRVLTFDKSVHKTIHTTSSRLALAHEFSVLASIRHPNIISVLDYGFDQEQMPYVVMQLVQNGIEFDKWAKTLGERGKVRLLIQLLQALEYLHQRGVVHRDLKPQNCLVEDGVLKLLDFGLATTHEQIGTDDSVQGTLAYLAPELFNGGLPSVTSDLYSVGIMAYEIFAGHHPFNKDDIADLVYQTVSVAPNMTAVLASRGIVQIISKLISKDEKDRYQSAREALQALDAHTGQAITLEQEDVRESFLQSAKLVGREKELHQLQTILRNAFNKNLGQMVLITGVSGTGKSRLIDEIRARALVDEFEVLTGQATAEASVPYAMWQSVLRPRLITDTELSEFEASVLKSIIPDLEELLQREVPAASNIDVAAAEERLFSVIRAVLQRSENAQLIILEDLHWAKGELKLIRSLADSLEGKKIVLIGTYRNDEAPDLQSQLGNPAQIKLESLQRAEIHNLVESMIGSVPNLGKVQEYLVEKSEGNVLFIVETLRYLADQVGQLRLIGSQPFPETSAVDGIQAIIARRLALIPEELLTPLPIAAIIGRRLDLEVIKHIHPNLELDVWLNELSDRSVINIRDNRWRFDHDQVRDGILNRLSKSEQIQLHQKAANALEIVYKDDIQAHYAELAYHWENSGNTAKAVTYFGQAAKQSLAAHANANALEYLEKANVLATQLPSEDNKVVYDRTMDLAEIYYRIGRHQESLTYGNEALKLRGSPTPKSSVLLAGFIIKELGQQAYYRLRTPTPKQLSDADRAELERNYSFYDRQVSIYSFLGDAGRGMYSTLRQLNLMEAGGPSAELVSAYATIAIIGSLTGIRRIGWYYYDLATTQSEKFDSPNQNAEISMKRAVFLGATGKWTDATDMALNARQQYVKLGNFERWGLCTQFCIHNNIYLGNLDGSFAYSAETYDMAHKRGDFTQMSWARTGEVEALLYTTKDYDQALELLDESYQLEKDTILATGTDGVETFVNTTIVKVEVMRALIYARQGKFTKAEKAIQFADEHLGSQRATNYSLYPSYIFYAEYYLRMIEAGQLDPSSRRASNAMKVLKSFANTFSFAKIRYAIYQAWLAFLNNDMERATQCLNEAAEHSSEYDMPIEAALIDFFRAKLAQDASSQLELLQKARGVFKIRGCGYHLYEIEQYIGRM